LLEGGTEEQLLEGGTEAVPKSKYLRARILTV